MKKKNKKNQIIFDNYNGERGFKPGSLGKT